MAEQSGIAAVYRRRCRKIIAELRTHEAVPVAEIKLPVSEFADKALRIVSPVVISLYEDKSLLRECRANIGIFIFSVAEMDEAIGILIVLHDLVKSIKITVGIGNNSNNHPKVLLFGFFSVSQYIIAQH